MRESKATGMEDGLEQSEAKGLANVVWPKSPKPCRVKDKDFSRTCYSRRPKVGTQ